MKFPKENDTDTSSIFSMKIERLAPGRRTKCMKYARIHFHAILCWLLRCSFLRPYRTSHNYTVACLSCHHLCSRFSRRLLQQSVDRTERTCVVKRNLRNKLTGKNFRRLFYLIVLPFYRFVYLFYCFFYLLPVDCSAT